MKFFSNLFCSQLMGSLAVQDNSTIIRRGLIHVTCNARTEFSSRSESVNLRARLSVFRRHELWCSCIRSSPVTESQCPNLFRATEKHHETLRPALRPVPAAFQYFNLCSRNQDFQRRVLRRAGYRPQLHRSLLHRRCPEDGADPASSLPEAHDSRQYPDPRENWARDG